MDVHYPDATIVGIAVASSITAYFALSLVFRNSQLPLLVSVFLFTNMISRTGSVQSGIRKAVVYTKSFSQSRSPAAPEGGRFAALQEPSQRELLEAVQSMADYAKYARSTNERRKRLYKLMSWRQQKLCDDAGYSKKLKAIDARIEKNQEMFDQIVSATRANYNLTFRHNGPKSSAQNTSSSNFRVIEALGHYVRDWSAAGAEEIEPMLSYTKKQLEAVIPPEEVANTCVVVPGSGLGRVAHEIALQGYGAVHAVEFSGLMHACNEFVYQPTSGQTHRFFPHIHSNSNFLDLPAQFREVSIPAGVPKPDNLHLHLDDFRYFSIPNREQYRNVVVVSAFFIDTAENIMDYFDQINQLTAPSRQSPVKNGYWINFGPLKYGSAAQAELNADEIKHIRKAIGWNDFHAANTIEESPEKVYGYITNKESLWQGYYGISMWAAAHKSNAVKR